MNLPYDRVKRVVTLSSSQNTMKQTVNNTLIWEKMFVSLNSDT